MRARAKTPLRMVPGTVFPRREVARRRYLSEHWSLAEKERNNKPEAALLEICLFKNTDAQRGIQGRRSQPLMRGRESALMLPIRDR